MSGERWTDEKAENTREDMLAAIEFYSKRGHCWISVVTYLGICHMFGGWGDLLDGLRPQKKAGRPRKVNRG